MASRIAGLRCTRGPEIPPARVLHQDSGGDLWLGTHDRGLFWFDPVGHTFVPFRGDPRDPGTLLGDTIDAIEETADGSLWIGTETGLGRLDISRERFETFRHDSTDPGSLTNDHLKWIEATRVT